MNRLKACLTVRLLNGIGPITAQKFVIPYGSTEAIFNPNSIPNETPNARLKALIREAGSLKKRWKPLQNGSKKKSSRFCYGERRTIAHYCQIALMRHCCPSNEAPFNGSITVL